MGGVDKDEFEAAIREGVIEIGTLAYSASPEELKHIFALLAEGILKTADALVPYFPDNLRFLWLTKYSEPLHALDAYSELPEILMEVTDFIRLIDEKKIGWDKLSAEDYQAVCHIIATISLYVRAIEGTLSAALLRESVGDFDS